MTLDFREVAEAVKKNNMGLGGIRFQAVAAVEGGRVKLSPTGQSFPLSGNPPPEGGPAWRTLQVKNWEDPAKTAVEVLPGPAAAPSPK